MKQIKVQHLPLIPVNLYFCVHFNVVEGFIVTPTRTTIADEVSRKNGLQPSFNLPDQLVHIQSRTKFLNESARPMYMYFTILL